MKNVQKRWILSILFLINEVWSFRCDRRPYGSMSPSSAPDGRFKLIVEDLENNSYLPEQRYIVQITETDGDSQFIRFMISAEGDMKPDPQNARRKISQFPGEIRPQDHLMAKYSDRCLYSVEQASNSPKTSVQVYWQAPPSGNGCVTLRAMVAENEDSWFENGPPLTLKICEDARQPDNVSPRLNYNCSVCDEAKYEVQFTGVWSRYTHPQLYPDNDMIPRYSDLVGASHAADFILWAPGTLVTDGFKDLAEHANSSKLEAEILTKIGDGVRTLIKGRGHGYKEMDHPTYAMFRTDKTNHLITVAIALFPSPDWFLGVSRFELCMADNTWLEKRELDLFLWDAGTDSGVSYESPNILTYPQDAVSRVPMNSYDKNSPFYHIKLPDVHPFGTLSIKLIRTYQKTCEETPDEEENPSEEKEEEKTEDETSEPENPSRYQYVEIPSDENSREGPEPVPEVDSESNEKCPMSQWQDWSPCEGPCRDGKVIGYKWRERYHMVDGVPIDMYDPHSRRGPIPEVLEECAEQEHLEHAECEEDCSDDDKNKPDLTVGRRVMAPIIPGSSWAKKRDTLKPKH